MPCSAIGTSSAPGTQTWSMWSSATPSAASSARQACASASVMLWLNRACTMPMYRPLPSRFAALPFSAPNIALVLSRYLFVRRDVAGNLEAVTGHAGHAARIAQEVHAVHAAFAQDLGTHAIGAQVQPPAFGSMRRPGLALELRQQLLRVLAAIEQDHHALALARNALEAGVQVPGVHGTVDFQRVEHRHGLVHAHGYRLVGRPLAFDQRQVQAMAGLVAPGMGDELAMRGLQRPAADLFDQRLIAAAVLDQVGDGADLQAVLGG